MTAFATDTFTDTNGTAITSHTPEVGTSWAAATWNSGAAAAVQSNKLQFPAEQYIRKAYYVTATPPSANYYGFLTRIAINENNRAMVGVRMSTSAQTGYFGGLDNSDNAAIWKWVDGSPTQLGTIACAQGTGTFYIEFHASGTTLELYVQRKSDDQWLTTTGNSFGSTKVACLSVTDSSVSATGKAGVWCETNHSGPSVYDVDTFGADDGTFVSDLSGNATLDDVSTSGGMSSAPTIISGNADLDDISTSGGLSSLPSQLTGSPTLDDIGASGSLGVQPGVLTVPELRNWAGGGALLTSELVPNVVVLTLARPVTLLAVFEDVTTHATTADLQVASGVLVPGTACMVLGFNSNGTQRFARPATVA